MVKVTKQKTTSTKNITKDISKGPKSVKKSAAKLATSQLKPQKVDMEDLCKNFPKYRKQRIEQVTSVIQQLSK